MANVLAIVNRKGGVGKTTTAVNLGAALAHSGYRVLLVDMDPSGDLSNHTGVELADGDLTVYEIITAGADVHSAIRTIQNERTGTAYSVIPADGALENLDETIPHERLRDALQTVAGDYDYIILDAQPTLGYPTAHVLTAADSALIPTGANYLAVDAVNATIGVIHDVQANLNPSLEVAGVLLTQYNPRITHQRAVRDAIADALPGHVLDVYTSTATAVQEAAAAGVDLYEYIARNRTRKHTRAAGQYTDLAQTIAERSTASGEK